jgi:Putative transposase of IS4/5 family (DUF4096)
MASGHVNRAKQAEHMAAPTNAASEIPLAKPEPPHMALRVVLHRLTTSVAYGAKRKLTGRHLSQRATLVTMAVWKREDWRRAENLLLKASFWEAALGVMDRLVLSDAAWERMAPLIIGRPDQKGSTGRDNRMFVEGVLWIVRTGSPWRDLPEAFGEWNSVFRRFIRWSINGVFGGESSRRCPMIQPSNI